MATKKVAKSQAETQSEMLEALKRVSEEKNIPVEALVASIEGSLASAYKKAYGGTGDVRVEADLASNEFRVFAQKRVVQTALTRIRKWPGARRASTIWASTWATRSSRK
jgi:N utilization substance protein A